MSDLRSFRGFFFVWGILCGVLLIVMASGLTKLCGGCTIPLSLAAGVGLQRLRLSVRRGLAGAFVTVGLAFCAMGSPLIAHGQFARSPTRIDADVLSAVAAIEANSSAVPPTVLSEEGIRNRVREFEAAYNAGDADALAAIYAVDATHTYALGFTHRGRAEIGKGLKEQFAGPFKGTRMAITPLHIRSLSSSIGVEEAPSRFRASRGADGAVLPPFDGFCLVVYQKDGDNGCRGRSVHGAATASSAVGDPVPKTSRRGTNRGGEAANDAGGSELGDYNLVTRTSSCPSRTWTRSPRGRERSARITSRWRSPHRRGRPGSAPPT